MHTALASGFMWLFTGSGCFNIEAWYGVCYKTVPLLGYLLSLLHRNVQKLRPCKDFRVGHPREKREVEKHRKKEREGERESCMSVPELCLKDRALNTTTCYESHSERERHCISVHHAHMVSSLHGRMCVCVFYGLLFVCVCVRRSVCVWVWERKKEWTVVLLSTVDAQTNYKTD